MKLRWKVYVPIELKSSTIKNINLKTNFLYKKLNINIKILGQNPEFYNFLPEDSRYVSKVDLINFNIDEFNIYEIKEENYSKICKIIIKINNRVIKNIRNNGIVLFINETYYETEYVNRYFTEWSIEYSADNKNWKSFLKGDESIKSLFIGRLRTGTLNVKFWPLIAEAIEDDSPVSPEREFVINAIEHMKNHNYRYSLIEAVIGLEIVMAQFLRNYLKINKNIPKRRIDDFLNPQLTLHARMSAMLNICLHENELKVINFDNIFQSINWRNDIIHKKGRLPDGIETEKLIKNISSVIDLINVLALKRDEILSLDKYKDLSTKIVDEFNTPKPKIMELDKHKIRIDFYYFNSSKLPLEKSIIEIKNYLITSLSKLDKKFDPVKHLIIRFKTFTDNILAAWFKNKLEFYNSNRKLPLK